MASAIIRKSYPDSFKIRMVKKVLRGERPVDLSDQFKVPISNIGRWKRSYRNGLLVVPATTKRTVTKSTTYNGVANTPKTTFTDNTDTKNILITKNGAFNISTVNEVVDDNTTIKIWKPTKQGKE